MCQFFSAIVTKDSILYNKYNDAHEDIITQYDLDDTTMEPNFVRVELVPNTNNDIFDKTLKNWIFKVDQDLIPSWFNAGEAEKKTKEALLSFYDEIIYVNKKNLIFENNERVFLKDSSVIVFDKSSAMLNGKSSAKLHNNSSAVLHNSSSAELYDWSSAKLYGWSSAKLYNHSLATLWNISSAELFEESSVVELCGDSTVKNYLSSNTRIMDKRKSVKFK